LSVAPSSPARLRYHPAMVPPIWVAAPGAGAGGWRSRFGWGDLALWALLVVIVIALAVAGWWSARDGTGP
jgi:hypothetical protein